MGFIPEIVRPFWGIIAFVLGVIVCGIIWIAVEVSSMNYEPPTIKSIADIPACNSPIVYGDLQNLYLNNQNPLVGKNTLLAWTNAQELSTATSPMIERDCSATAFFSAIGKQKIIFKMFFVHPTDDNFLIESALSD